MHKSEPARARGPGDPRPAPASLLAGSPVLRRRLGAVRRAVIESLQRLDPSRAGLSLLADGAGVAVIGVYRTANVGRVCAALRDLPDGVEVRLWALDAVAPALAAATAGHGPGIRCALLNRLIRTLPPGAAARALVLLDDDVEFVVGDLGRLVATGDLHQLDLWQPAHTATSHASFGFVRRRWLSVVRTTSFVEQGPVVVLSDRAQQALLPLPEDLGMAWGVEMRWATSAERAGLRLGILDAAGLRHVTPGGAAYDRDEQEQVLAAELASAGLFHITDAHRELGRVSVWRSMRSGSGAIRSR